jgi:hypothetical protein
MKVILNFILLSLLGVIIFPEIFAALAFGLTLCIALQIFLKSNESFMFREWALFLYALNYLLSPAITYQFNNELSQYSMKITSDAYFSLAFPGYLFFVLGMYIIPNKLFKPELKKVSQAAVLNERLLIQITFVGIFLKVFSSFFNGDFGFFVYLISMLRFVGSFSLFATNVKKYSWLVLLVIVIELFSGFQAGMYHDALMWVVFFALFFVYIVKPSVTLKSIGVFCIVVLILFVQAIKGVYREQIWEEGKEANIETIASVGSENANSEAIIGKVNLFATLNRGNQAWIFASTVNRMDGYKDFQGLTNVNKYIEAALLPRFLAPNKLESGNKEIFNQFSGHSINEGTSMGLGVFADGYIAYSTIGVYVFGFCLGLFFSLTFKLVERWTRISPFYVLLLLPMLNYAVRPDCELQTTINHLVKSIMVLGVFVYFTKNRFTLDSTINQRKLLHLNLVNKK